MLTKPVCPADSSRNHSNERSLVAEPMRRRALPSLIFVAALAGAAGVVQHGQAQVPSVGPDKCGRIQCADLSTVECDQQCPHPASASKGPPQTWNAVSADTDAALRAAVAASRNLEVFLAVRGALDHQSRALLDTLPSAERGALSQLLDEVHERAEQAIEAQRAVAAEVAELRRRIATLRRELQSLNRRGAALLQDVVAREQAIGSLEQQERQYTAWLHDVTTDVAAAESLGDGARRHARDAQTAYWTGLRQFFNQYALGRLRDYLDPPAPAPAVTRRRVVANGRFVPTPALPRVTASQMALASNAVTTAFARAQPLASAVPAAPAATRQPATVDAVVSSMRGWSNLLEQTRQAQNDARSLASAAELAAVDVRAAAVAAADRAREQHELQSRQRSLEEQVARKQLALQEQVSALWQRVEDGLRARGMAGFWEIAAQELRTALLTGHGDTARLIAAHAEGTLRGAFSVLADLPSAVEMAAYDERGDSEAYDKHLRLAEKVGSEWVGRVLAAAPLAGGSSAAKTEARVAAEEIARRRALGAVDPRNPASRVNRQELAVALWLERTGHGPLQRDESKAFDWLAKNAPKISYDAVASVPAVKFDEEWISDRLQKSIYDHYAAKPTWVVWDYTRKERYQQEFLDLLYDELPAALKQHTIRFRGFGQP